MLLCESTFACYGVCGSIRFDSRLTRKPFYADSCFVLRLCLLRGMDKEYIYWVCQEEQEEEDMKQGKETFAFIFGPIFPNSLGLESEINPWTVPYLSSWPVAAYLYLALCMIWVFCTYEAVRTICAKDACTLRTNARTTCQHILIQ